MSISCVETMNAEAVVNNNKKPRNMKKKSTGETKSSSSTNYHILDKSSSYEKFLIKHKCTKDDPNGNEKTHYRMPDPEIGPYHAGAYSIPEEEYATFIDLYFKEIVSKNKYDTMVENQLANDGPFLVDIDLHFDVNQTTRVYTFDHIEELIDKYLECFLEIYQFNDETSFKVFILEKDNLNLNTEKDYVKDGIHIIFGVQIEKKTKSIITEKIKKEIKEIWSDFPLKNNEWENVLDDAVTSGSSGWQLLNSKKSKHEAYKLTHVFEISYEEGEVNNEDETETEDEDSKKKSGGLIKHEIDTSPFLTSSSGFIEMTARYKEYPSYFYKTTFLSYLKQLEEKEKTKVKKNAGGNGNSNTSDDSFTDNYSLDDILNIQNSQELDSYVDKFLKNNNNEKEIVFKEIYGYIMTLPSSYYGDSSYTKWIRVCWALKHISSKLFIVFLKFSSQAGNFSYPTSIVDTYDHWKNSDTNKEKILTIRSIMFWSRTEAPEEYKKVREESLNYYIDLTMGVAENYSEECLKFLGKCSDYDIARVVYHYLKDEFVCVNITKNIWYRFVSHRWVENDSGTTLRKYISTDIYKFYSNLMNGFGYELAAEIGKEDQNEKKIKSLGFKMTRASDIMLRLKTTTDKRNIMMESRDLFYDSTFYEKLDCNTKLLCFKNGVYDFNAKMFRDGYPEDYISMSTNINYIQYEKAMRQTQIVDEINDFMQKLFPEKELLQYMWDHLSSTLLGDSKNQTFNMYIGCGQNGKSVLVSFMEKVLGQYKGDVPLSLITDKRGKVGGVSPEIVELKGIRYAVMQEPSKGDKINEGIMKSITGSDPIMGRAPYQVQTVHYEPQFKLVVCSNELMEIVSQDHGTWRRIRVVEYKSLFVENPVQNDPQKPYQFKLDKDIKEKFNSWKEVFASMLVKRVNETGGNVKDCEQVLKASNDYKNSQNYCAEFVSEKIIKSDMAVLKKEHFTALFCEWFTQNRGGKPTIHNIQDAVKYMTLNYAYDKPNTLWKGAMVKTCIPVYSTIQENLEVEDDFELEEI